VETSVAETTIESWIGVGNVGGGGGAVDAVLLINVLGHVGVAARRALFQQLMSHRLTDAGIVVVCSNVGSVRTGVVALMERLGGRAADCDEFEAELVATGFRVAVERRLEFRRDLRDPSDGLVKFLRMRTGASDTQVRAAVDEIFSRPDADVSVHKLAIFTK